MPPKYRKKTKYIYKKGSKKPYRLSRSKIDLFVECPRCFYLDQRLGVRRPSFPAFTLNSAVDELLKKEFDVHRNEGTTHPLMKEYGIDAVPYENPNMEEWRNNFKGVSYIDRENNFEVFGAVDDLWINNEGQIHVVDYKATSKNDTPDLEGFWQQAYKRQIEVYQWILRKNDLKVANVGYFVYANGRRDEAAFDGRLEFEVIVLPYEGDDSWIPGVLKEIKGCLDSEDIPDVGEYCEHCPYREIAGKSIREHVLNDRQQNAGKKSISNEKEGKSQKPLF